MPAQFLHGGRSLFEHVASALAAVRPVGPSGTSSSATENRSVRDRFIVLTGANRGVGYETARILLQRGGVVVLGCRAHSDFPTFADRLARRVAHDAAFCFCDGAVGDSDSVDEHLHGNGKNTFVHDDLLRSENAEWPSVRESTDGIIRQRVVRRVLANDQLGGRARELVAGLVEIEAARFAKNESRSTSINQEFYEEREIAFARALAAELRSSGYLEGKIRERIIALPLDLTDLSSVKRFEKGAKKALLDYVRRERDSKARGPRSEDGAALRRGLNLKSEQEEVQRRFHALICNAAVWAGPESENLPFSVNCVGHHHLINKLSKGDDGHGYSLFGGSLKASHFSVSRLLAQQHQQKEQNPERNTAGRVAAAPAVKNKPRIVFVTSGLLQFGTLPDELQQRLGRGQLQGDSVEREEGHRGDEPEEPTTFRALQARHEYADSKLVNALQHLAYASVFGHVVDTAAVCPGWCATRLGRPSTAAAGRTDSRAPIEGGKAGDQVQEKIAVVPSIVQPTSCPFASSSPRNKPAVAGGGESTSSTSWQMITGFLIPAMLRMRLPRSAEEGGAEVVEATIARLETTSISGANSDPLARSGFFAAGASSESGRPDAIQRRCEVEVAKYVHSDYLRPTFFARFLRGLDQIVEARKQ